MSNANNPGDTGDTNQEAPLTKEAVSEMINTALGMREKRAEKRLSDMLDGKLAALQQGKSQTETQTDSAQAQAGDSETAALRREMESMKRKYAESEKKRLESAKREGMSKAHQELTSALTASGKIKPEAVAMVVDLIKGRGQVEVSDDGQAFYRMGEETFTIQESAERFLASKEVDYFAPAPQAGFNGRASTKPPVRGAATDSKTQVLDGLIAELPSAFKQ